MARLAMVTMLIFLVITMTLAQTQEDGSDQVSWANRNDNGKETVINLQFYFHDSVSGKNPSAVPVAQANQTNTSPTGFGLLVMADDPLTVAADPNSKLVGRARGLYGSAGQTELGLIMVMNFGFTGGIYNGSSFTIATLNPALNPVRELSIVGGTGLFRLARGYVIARTYSLDLTTGNAIVGYNATLVTFN